MRLKSCRPARAKQGTEQTSGQKVQNDRPTRGNCTEWYGGHPERQRRSDDNQADGLVEDDPLKRSKPEWPDQQWQQEFRTAQTNQTVECADASAAYEGRGPWER